MDCVSDNELVELLEGRLATDRRVRVLEELERCPDCRTIARDWAMTSVRFDQPADPPAPAPAATPVGERGPTPATVGAYRLDQLIGAGAMGLVFRGHDAALDRAVAIKIVHAAGADALDEGRLLATVRHRNVISVHAAGATGDLAYLVMELVDGTSLDRVLAARGGKVPWRLAVRWFAGVADGLAAAHAARVIHRDVKPGNLLLDGDELRLADFGLASSQGGAPAGTPAYAAPEVVAGGEATAASDQYSLCVALYEAIAGARPARPAAGAAIDVWPAIPAALRRVIARGLDPEPARRWPGMVAVATALRATAAPRLRWPYAIAGVAVIGFATATLIHGRRAGGQCDAPDPGWAAATPAGAGWPARLHAAAVAHQTRWRAAYARTCTGPLAPRQRACLAAGRARVDAIVVSLGAAPDPAAFAAGVQAMATIAPPERCLTSPELVPTGDPAAIARAEALQALARPTEALAALPPADRDDAPTALLRGRIAKDLQDLPAAETALRRAVELASRDDLAPVLADAQTDLALVVGFLQSRHDAGVAYVDAAVSTAERLGDRRRAAIARIVGGLVAQSRGDIEAAIAAITTGIADLAANGAQPVELATAEMRLGWVLSEARRGADARVHFDRALAERTAVLGADHPAVGLIEVEIGRTETTAGDYAAAIKRYRDVIDRLTPTVGPTHPTITGAWSALGAAQVHTGDYAGAEASFTTVLALRRQVSGDHNVDVARAYVNLASTAYYQGKYDAALESYRAAEAISRSVLGGDNPEVATIETGIALALQGAGRLDEAATANTEAIAIYRAHPGHDAALADALQSQGILELTLEHLPPARAALEEGLAILRGLYGDGHVELASMMSTLAELYLAMHRLDDAERLAEAARALRADHGAAPQLVAENELVLAYIAIDRGKRARADQLATAALDHCGDGRPDLREMIETFLRTHEH